MKTLKQLMIENNFLFKKHFAQNFLTDTNLLEAIVKDANITPQDEVLEIGPGAGSLTKAISKFAKKVICYEIDKTLEPLLGEALKGQSNVKIIFKDILEQSEQEIKSNFTNSFKVVANLPYYITTPILFKFLESSLKIDSLTIMVQKEVAQRLIAKPKTKDYGALTVSANYRAEVKITRIVSRKMFMPAPNVDSAIVRLEFNKNKYDIKEESLLKQLIKAAFSMRRKTLANNLKAGLNLSNEQITTLFESLSINPLARAEELKVEQFVMLANNLADTK